ncbi:ABC transporter ATP-binding protein [Allorhizobium pseudoryzae]|uniref:ABC transporter ATP-binding protein n=1 Tax=Allorhizobium pseudoryzae TaxID=379684 RepID=UPI003D08C239
MSPLLSTTDLRVAFPVGGGLFSKPKLVRAVDGISLDVHAGETLAVVGESGCGKTTLGRTLAMLQRPTSGSITFDDARLDQLGPRDLRAARRSMQMIFQDPYASLNPRQRIAAIVAEPLLIAGVGAASVNIRVAELLDLVGLGAEAGARLPRAFSGGQRQRIGIARALAASPKLIICDEPLSALDVSIQAQIVNLLVRLQRQFGLTYVFISHDLAVVRQMASRVAVMYLGVIVELADVDALFARPRHPYTTALLSAVPTLAVRNQPAAKPLLVAGDPPSPLNRPAGCRFHPRCWLRKQLDNPSRCTSEEPKLVGPDTQRVACHFSEEAAMQPRTGANEPAAAGLS